MANGGFFGGLAGGLQQGFNISGQIQERQAQVQARMAEIQQQKRDNALSDIDAGAKLLKIPGFELEGRRQANRGAIALGGQGLSEEQLGTVGDKLDKTLGRASQLIAEFKNPKSPIFNDQDKLMVGFENLRREAISAFGVGSEEAKVVAETAKRQIEAVAPPTVTELKAETIAKLSSEDRRRLVLKPDTVININRKPASPSERTALASTEASIDSLNNLKTLFDESFTGPFAGRKGSILNVFGLNPPKQEAFIAASAAFRNQVIKEITGAQMSESEATRILEQVPSETDASSVWLAKYEQSIQNLERLNKRRREVLEQSGLRVPGGESAELDTINKRIKELEGQQ